jgi:Meiotically up-regulated gene 113
MMSAYKQAAPVRQKGLHLYLIQSAVTEAVKIGRSSDPHKRLRELQTGSPHRLTLLAVFDGKGDLEPSLHQRLDRWRLKMKGEWFSPECLAHLPDWIQMKLQT